MLEAPGFSPLPSPGAPPTLPTPSRPPCTCGPPHPPLSRLSPGICCKRRSRDETWILNLPNTCCPRSGAPLGPCSAPLLAAARMRSLPKNAAAPPP